MVPDDRPDDRPDDGPDGRMSARPTVADRDHSRIDTRRARVSTPMHGRHLHRDRVVPHILHFALVVVVDVHVIRV